MVRGRGAAKSVPCVGGTGSASPARAGLSPSRVRMRVVTDSSIVAVRRVEERSGADSMVFASLSPRSRGCGPRQ
jgi:hypothetical protein